MNPDSKTLRIFDKPLPKVCIVSTIRNARDTIDDFLDAVLNQDYSGPVDVLIVDAYSDDGTYETILSRVASNGNMRVVQESCNQPSGLNLGIGLCYDDVDIIALTDGDACPDPNWISIYVDEIIHGKNILGGACYTSPDSGLIQRIIGLDFDARFLSLTRGPILRLPNLNMCGLRSVFIDTPFNETLDIAYDQDFGLRLRKKGYVLEFIPEAIVYHKHRSDLFSFCKQQFKSAQWSIHVYLNNPSSVLEDKIVPKSMSLQPLFIVGAVFGIIAGIFAQEFLIISLISILSILAIWVRAFVDCTRKTKNPLCLFIIPLYILRVYCWFWGGVYAAIASLKEAVLNLELCR